MDRVRRTLESAGRVELIRLSVIHSGYPKRLVLSVDIVREDANDSLQRQVASSSSARRIESGLGGENL